MKRDLAGVENERQGDGWWRQGEGRQVVETGGGEMGGGDGEVRWVVETGGGEMGGRDRGR